MAGPTPEPAPTAAPEPAPAASDDDAVTRAYVTKAIDYYRANGLDATIEFYRSRPARKTGAR